MEQLGLADPEGRQPSVFVDVAELTQPMDTGPRELLFVVLPPLGLWILGHLGP
jgi:hypothetical protein